MWKYILKYEIHEVSLLLCSLTDESLQHFLRLGTTNITVDVPALVKESDNPCAHIKTDRNA
jgi:hypothetical protein